MGVFSSKQLYSSCRRFTGVRGKKFLLLLAIAFLILVSLHDDWNSEAKLRIDYDYFEVLDWTNYTISPADNFSTDEITVVTAYFNIGQFDKGDSTRVYSPDLYHKWMHVFARLESPVVAYFDNNDDLQYFRKIRSRLADNTVTVLVNREKMWSFALEPDISKIFSRFWYPKHIPNTVIPSYSAAMHAKYEVMNQTIAENPFKTMYFCWLDIGLFRDFAVDTEANPNGPRFSLYLPENYQKDSVAYQEVWDRDPEATAKQIIRDNMVWVCGCFFIGSAHAIHYWAAEYKAIVHHLVYNAQLMSTDQQVIYIGYNSASPPKTIIQTYRDGGHRWFGLGYKSLEAGFARTKQKQMQENIWKK